MSSFTSSSVGSVKWVSCNEQGSLQVAKVDSVLKPVWNQTTNLISIFGRPRQGKSFLMNCLAGETDIFRISNEKESCTQGIDLSRKFMKLEEFSRVDQGYGLPNKNHHSSNSFVGFVDAEGQGDKDVSYDANLICPILLTSKCVIFNWKGDLQKNYILSTLGIMTRAAQNVAQEGSTGRHKFGHLHIVFRDWQAVESDANSTYAALFDTESSHEASTRNQIRHDVLEAFQSVQVWLFEAPTERVADLRKNLTIDLTSTSFREHIRSLRRVLAAQLSEPTVLAGQVVTGRLLTGLVSNLQDTLNRGEAVLPSSAYLAMLRQEVVGLKDAYDKEARKMLADLPVEALGDFPPTMNEITASVQEQFHELDLVYEVKLVEIIGSHPSPDSQGLVRDFHASVKTLQENLISAFLSAQRNRFGAWLLEKKQLAQKIFEEELKKMIETDKDLLSDEDLRARLDEIWQSTVLTPLGGVDRYDDYPEHIDAIKTLEWIFKNLSEQVRKANQKRVEENQALADRLNNEAIKPIDLAVEKVLDRIRSASVPGLHQRDISGSLNQLHAENHNDLQQKLRNSPFPDSVLKPVWNQTANLISIFGRARQGKSFLMNCLAGETDIFRISNEKESCTQGIDLSRKFMKLEEFSRVDQGYGLPNKNHHSSNSFVGFVDAEGQGDKDVSYDANLICPILLTSKCVIFNWKGDLQKNYILSTLGIMTRAAQNVAQEGSTGRHKFGHLHIVFRDWQAVESDANSTYAALFNTESSHEASTRNQIRHDVLEAFQSVQVWLFEAPTERVADLRKNLTIDLTSTSFREHIRSLRRVLAAQLSEPTVLAGQVVTGRLLTGLVSNLQDTLNRGEAVSPSSAYLAMLRQEVVGLKDAYDKEARKMLADLPVEALGDFPPTMNEITASVQEQFHELDLVYEVKLVEIIGSHPSPDSQGLVRDFHASVKTLQENLISAFLSAQRNRFGAWLLEKKQLAQKIFEEELKKMIETDKDLLSDEDLRARLDEIWQSTVLTPLGGVDRYDDYPEHVDAIKTLEWIFKNLSEQVRKANQKRVEENQALADRLTNEAIKPIDVVVEKVLDRIRSASVPGLHQSDISGSLNQLHAEKQNDLQQRLRKSPFLGIALAQFNQHCSTRLEDIQALYHDKANAAYGDAIDRAEQLLQDRFQTLAQQWDDLEDGVQIDSAIQDIDQSIHNIWKQVVTSVHGWMDVDCQEEAMAEHPFGRELKGLLNRQREPFVYALQELFAQEEEDTVPMDVESKDVFVPDP